MSTLLSQIKSDQLTARKSKDTIRSLLLTTLLGEAQAIGKNDGNRETTDAEVQAIIKKFVKNISETITAMGDVSNDDKSADRHATLLSEKSSLEAYMPSQITGEDLARVIRDIILELRAETEQATNVGAVMKTLKERYLGRYDGTTASYIVKVSVAGQ